MSQAQNDPQAIEREQQQRKAASAAAEQAAAQHNTPHDITERTRMQRQSKNNHQKSGKTS